MTMHARDARPAVIIFRKVLLPWSETFIAAQGTALARYRPVFAGYRIRAAGNEYLAGQDRVVLDEHARLPALGKGMNKTLRLVPRGWRKALEAHEPVLLHAHFGTSALDALPIARTLRIPIVVTYHGTDIASRPRHAWHRWWRAHVFANTSRAIAVSHFMAGQLRAAGCPHEKIIVHYIGVDTERFQPPPAGSRSPSQILFVGRLVTKKGLVHLLRAMPRVQRAVPDAELLIAGDGALRDSLESEASALGVRCRFLGVQTPEQVRDLMRHAAVLCSPSVVAPSGNAEALGIVNLEAQACGLPVVAFASGGLPEGLVDGATGLLAPEGDEEALASQLVRLLADDTLRTRFSAAARDHMVTAFDLRRQTAKLEAIYDDVRGAAAPG
jgi:glycosyltransferase involved in cell wall biosynthesis